MKYVELVLPQLRSMPDLLGEFNSNHPDNTIFRKELEKVLEGRPGTKVTRRNERGNIIHSDLWNKRTIA